MKGVIGILSLAGPVASVVLEALPAIPSGWKVENQAIPKDTQLQLHVALKYQNLDQLESTLASVSTPGSPKYGKYQDISAQSTMFAPSNDSISKVHSWLTSSGASNIRQSGATVSFTTTVDNANSMLSSDFKTYTNGAAVKLRTTQYSVPDDLDQHIDLITPTTYFGDLQKPQSIVSPSTTANEEPTKRQAQTCFQTTFSSRANGTGYVYDSFSPECLRELYKTNDYTPDPKSGSNIAFANFLNQTPSHADLKTFETKFGIPQQDFTTLAILNGGVDDQDPTTAQDGEANLDVQHIVNIAQGLPVYSYITGGLAPFYPDLLEPNISTAGNEPYEEFYDYLLSQPNSKLPYIFSQSYADHENTVPNRYAARVCNQIGMLGLRGRTVLAGTGDEGVGAVCRDNRPVGNLYGAPQFTPFFPATCPYITAVGGTQFQYPEAAWNATGGGFSFYFPTAWYQRQAVNTYLNNHISAGTKEYYSSNNYVNFSGRAIPDISAHSLYPWYIEVVGGRLSPTGGTSAATPVVAGVIGLLNDARLRAGQPAMGFINPWLYSAGASSLTDITLGGAVGCNGHNLQSASNPPVVPGAAVIPYASWNATPGWDPATGLGTPDFPKLKDAALQATGWKSVPGWVWNWPPSGGWGWRNGGWRRSRDA